MARFERSAIDRMIEAQFAYETARLEAYGYANAPVTHVAQFVSAEQMREIEDAVGMRSRVTGHGAYAVRILDYRGCIFQTTTSASLW